MKSKPINHPHKHAQCNTMCGCTPEHIDALLEMHFAILIAHDDRCIFEVQDIL